MNEKATILAVDDTSESLSLLARLLGAAGYEVRPADSGELALAAVAAAPPDLILLDIRMRGIDGLEVCRRLKASAVTRHIPIILLSASTEIKERVEGLRVGAADFISKPFHSEELLMRVKMHLALSRATASLEGQAAALSKANEQLQTEVAKRQSIEGELRHSLDQAERSRRAMLNTLEDQKRAEEALKESEDKFSKAFQTSPYAVTITRPDNGRFIEVNGAFVSMSGFTREEALADSSIGLKSWVNEKERERVVAALRAGHTVVGQEYLFRTKSGRIITCSFSAQMIQLSLGTCVLSSINDISDQKRAEEALRESEEKYRSIFDNSIEGIYQTTPEGRHIAVNPAFARMFGFKSPEEMIAAVANIGEELYVHPEDRLRLIALMSSSDGMVRDFGAQLKRHDGSKFCVSISARMHKDADGKATFIEGTCVDVTDRMRAEMALKTSESRYRTIFGESPVAIWEEDLSAIKSRFDELRRAGVTDFRSYLDHNPDEVASLAAQVRVIEANRRSVELLGADSAEHLASKLPSFFNDDSRRIFKEELIALAEGQTAFHAELPAFNAKGEWLLLDLTMVVPPEHAHDLSRVLVSFVDITQRKRAEEALRRKSAMDNALADLAAQILTPDEPVETTAAVVLRNAQALTDSSQGFVSSIDTKSGDNVAHTLTKMLARSDNAERKDPRIIYPVSPDGFYSGLSGHALNTRMPFFTNDPQKHASYVSLPQGHAPIRNFLAVPVLVQDELLGEIVLSGSSRDYTDVDLVNVRRMAELYGMYLRDRRTREELSHSEAQLRQAQKMEAVGRLAGGVAHDFNNMLQVILGSSEIAMAQAEPGSQLFQFLNEIKKAGHRSADLTRQLLAFARKQTIAPKQLDLNDAVAGMLKMLARLIGEDINLVWRPGKGAQTVLIDPSQLDQILANLTVNSRDAITGVGSITIETSSVDVGEGDTSPGLIPGKYVVLSVSDDGCGMGKETIANIFEPFFTTKELGRGTGLGLATIYGIVKQNNGYINVYSEPEKGTTFKIYLPRYGEQVAPSAANGVNTHIPTGTETVLLVEDEPTLLVIISQFLERLGYTVLASGNPISALQLAERHAGNVDLLMTDVVMPDMSGHELWRNVSARWRGVKCLYMSGYPANVIAQQGVLEDGANFLQKPFSVNALASKLREVLGSNDE
ncbi:MAG: response regulator [Candidatus Brocadiia bacterium]